MAGTEKILITELIDDAIWLRLRDKFNEHDVEEASEDENVYDLRAGTDITDDRVFFWGRDGWANGFWHAMVYLERHETSGRLLVYAQRGDNPDCMNLMPFRKKLLAFMDDCMSAKSMKQEIPT